jgi:hypothetical protein
MCASLRWRSIVVGTETIRSVLSPDASRTATQSLAKAVYSW